MKTGYIVGGIIATAALGGLAYSMLVPPRFTLRECDYYNHKGKVEFGRKEYTFEKGGAFVANGRFGWNLAMTSKEDGKPVFKLYKKDKFVKELGTC